MTPQQRALADVLHISLVKWAESMHKMLDHHKRAHPERAEEFTAKGREVEETMDRLIASPQHKSQDEVMKIVDDLHKQIVDLRA